MIIAQITDAHVTVPGQRLYGDYDPGHALTQTLRALAALTPVPDVVLFTGDLTDIGTPAEYEALRDLLNGFPLPLAVIPGNHDRRDAFAAAFASGPVRAGSGRFLHLVLDDWPVRLVGLDTLSGPGVSAGLLCEERLDWIDATLAEAPDRPTLIFMHHPPFPTGIGFMDAIACENGDRLADIVARHPSVLRVICGHVHRPVHTLFGGAVASICPSVAHKVGLTLAEGAPEQMLREDPAFQLHVWTGGAGFVTHTEYLRDDGS